jgi:hypothetical protein
MIETVEMPGSQYSTEFHRPMTSAAVLMLDPQLQLVYNRKYGLFQVIRWTLIACRYYVPGLGNLLSLERGAMWECDVAPHHHIDTEDSPGALIHDMVAGDTKAHPRLLEDAGRLGRIMDHRARIEERVRDEWKHHSAWNRAQILKVWQPIYDMTGGFVAGR